MRSLKKRFAILLVLAMLVGMVALPASADDVVIAITKSATKLSNGRWNVSINFAGNPTTLADSIQAYNMAVQYDKSVVTYANKLNNDTSPTANDGKGPDGNVVLSGWSGTDGIQDSETGDIKESGTLFRLQFTPVNADATEADILAAVSVIEGVDDNGTLKSTSFANGAGDEIPFTGVDRTLDSVTLIDSDNLDVTEVTVGDKDEAVTIYALAKTATNADLNTSVTWESDNDKVTVDANGVVTVAQDTAAGVVTITATGDSEKSVSGTKSATFTVVHAASKATTIEVSREDKLADGDKETLQIPADGTETYAYTVVIKDQYGGEMGDFASTNTIDATYAGVTVEGTSLVVASTALPGTFEATFKNTAPSANGIELTVNIELISIEITWPTATTDGATYGQTLEEMVTIGTDGSAKVGETAVDGTFTVKATANTKVDAAGTTEYVINFTSTDGTYDVDSETKTLTIAPKAVTVTANDAEKVYRTDDPSFTVTENGVLDGDTLTYTVTRADGEDAGTYDITPTGAEEQGNYKVTFVNGTFTITKADAKIELMQDSTTATYGADPIEVDISAPVDYTGEITAESENDSIAAAKVEGRKLVVTIAAAGETTITVSGAADTNYNAPESATFTITINPATIEKVELDPETVTVTYGDEVKVPAIKVTEPVPADAEGTIKAVADDAYFTAEDTTAKKVGTTAMTIAVSADNYDDTYTVDVDVTINPATLTLTSKDVEATEGDSAKLSIGQLLDAEGFVLEDGLEACVTYDLVIKDAEGNEYTEETLKIGEYTYELTLTDNEMMANYTGYEKTFTGKITVSAVPVVTQTVKLTVAKATNGTVTADPKSPKAGDTVTITVTPDEGYRLDTVKAVGAKTGEITLTKNEDGTYSFTMPKDSVTVTATFEAFKFTDVPKDSWFNDAVYWAVANDVTEGTGDGTTFSPNMDCTRAMVVTFLWRAAGAPEPTATEAKFTDFEDNAWYTKAVYWAVENGITTGTGDGTTFEPNKICTRAEVATFITRAMKLTAEGAEMPFTDVEEGAWYYDSVAAVYAAGITTGTGDGTTFEPAKNCTRAEIVTFLYRAYKD